MIGLVTGCSWVTAERLLGGAVSDTTLRARRDEWIAAGVFDALAAEALAAHDRIVGLDLSDAAVDESIHKAPCGGDGTGKKPPRIGADMQPNDWRIPVEVAAFGFTNFANYRIRALLYASKPDRALLDTLTPT